MLGYVYWHSATHTGYEVAFNVATLGGCIFGMILFGFLADHFGRRKLYGIALMVLIVGTFGVVTSSVGFTPIRHNLEGDYAVVDWETRGSMNIIALLLWWRFVSGVGLGGDYVSLSYAFPCYLHISLLISEASDRDNSRRICTNDQASPSTRLRLHDAGNRYCRGEHCHFGCRICSKEPPA
jgi:MFS family permease